MRLSKDVMRQARSAFETDSGVLKKNRILETSPNSGRPEVSENLPHHGGVHLPSHDVAEY